MYKYFCIVGADALIRPKFGSMWASTPTIENYTSKLFVRQPLNFLKNYFAAFVITAKSALFSEAPPIRPPSMSAFAKRPAQLAAFIEPPY